MGAIEYGALLQTRRAYADLHQKDVAAAIGMSRPNYSTLERGGIACPGADTVNAIAAILPLSVPEQLRALGYHLPVETVAPEAQAHWDALRGIVESLPAPRQRSAVLMLRVAAATFLQVDGQGEGRD